MNECYLAYSRLLLSHRNRSDGSRPLLEFFMTTKKVSRSPALFKEQKEAAFQQDPIGDGNGTHSFAWALSAENAANPGGGGVGERILSLLKLLALDGVLAFVTVKSELSQTAFGDGVVDLFASLTLLETLFPLELVAGRLDFFARFDNAACDVGRNLLQFELEVDGILARRGRRYLTPRASRGSLRRRQRLEGAGACCEQEWQGSADTRRHIEGTTESISWVHVNACDKSFFGFSTSGDEVEA